MHDKKQELSQEIFFDPQDAQQVILSLAEIFKYNLFEVASN